MKEQLCAIKVAELGDAIPFIVRNRDSFLKHKQKMCFITRFLPVLLAVWIKKLLMRRKLSCAPLSVFLKQLFKTYQTDNNCIDFENEERMRS